MSIPCTRCGSPLADDAYRCPDCEALAPLPPVDDAAWSRSVFDAPASAVDPTTIGPGADPDVTRPWAIPVREGTGARDPLRPVLVVVLVVALLAGMTVAGAEVFTGGDAPSETADGAVARPGSTATSAAASSTAVPTTSTSTSTSTTVTTSTTTVPTTTTVPSAGSAAVLPSSFGGGWIAQLTSVPTAAGAAKVEAAWRAARGYAAGAVVTRSDEWSSLSSGFWVVLHAGPFGTADDARAYCASIGHDCLARQLDGRR